MRRRRRRTRRRMRRRRTRRRRRRNRSSRTCLGSCNVLILRRAQLFERRQLFLQLLDFRHGVAQGLGAAVQHRGSYTRPLFSST